MFGTDRKNPKRIVGTAGDWPAKCATRQDTWDSFINTKIGNPATKSVERSKLGLGIQARNSLTVQGTSYIMWTVCLSGPGYHSSCRTDSQSPLRTDQASRERLSQFHRSRQSIRRQLQRQLFCPQGAFQFGVCRLFQQHFSNQRRQKGKEQNGLMTTGQISLPLLQDHLQGFKLFTLIVLSPPIWNSLPKVTRDHDQLTWS